jgi:O-antigen ligase
VSAAAWARVRGTLGPWPVVVMCLAVLAGGALEFDVGSRRYGINSMQVAVAAVAVGGALAAWHHRRFRIDPVLLPYAVLAAIPIVQALVHGGSPASWGGIGRFATVFVLLVALPQYRRGADAFANWDLPITWLGGAIGIWTLVKVIPALTQPALEFYEVKDYVRLPLGNHNYVGAVLVTTLTVMLAVGRTTWPIRVATVFAGIGLAFTLSRGAWLAFALVLVALLMHRRDRRTAVTLGLLTLGAVLLATLLILLGEDSAERLRGLLSPATADRIELWRAAVDAFVANPWLGVGIDRVPEWMGATKQLYDHAHNLVLEALMTTGVVGAGAYLTYWAMAGWRAWRLPTTALRMGLGLPLMALFVHAQVDTLSYLLVYEVLVAMFVGIAATYDGTLPTIRLARGAEPADAGQ